MGGLIDGPVKPGPASSARPQPERWRVRGGTVRARLDSWSEILAATHLGFDVHATNRTPDDFHGAVKRRAVGELILVDCAASPFVGHRGDSLIGAADAAAQSDDILGFQFVYKGLELVREGGRELALSAGDVVLWDGLQPTEIEIVEPFYKRTLLFPRERVLSVCPRLGPQGAPLARRQRIGSAARPLLAPASIARAYSMSVRALHALFEDTDTSVAGLVRGERLARCLEDLQRPNGGSVTDIAFRWGFCDAAHFSRVFKREFGATPSDVRQAAIAAAERLRDAGPGPSLL
jgi:AraC-like DNA-binding protein